MFIYVYLCLSMFIYVYLCLSMFIYVYLCLSIFIVMFHNKIECLYITKKGAESINAIIETKT